MKPFSISSRGEIDCGVPGSRIDVGLPVLDKRNVGGPAGKTEIGVLNNLFAPVSVAHEPRGKSNKIAMMASVEVAKPAVKARHAHLPAARTSLQQMLSLGPEEDRTQRTL